MDEINGTKCAKLVKEDIEGEIVYWQNAVICCVLGVNPPFEVIEGYVRRIWKDFAINKVILIKKGLCLDYLVRFMDYSDAMKDVWAYTRELQKIRNSHKGMQSQITDQDQPTEGVEPRGEDDFQIVTRHITRHYVAREEGQGEIAPMANTYNVLLEEEGN
ncbi:hypothetical protein Cgig2_013282 [Carnegiea gigantea]|uniref:Uncharacterized protein n=1 Tax=Carnegiea gigantea TaxID=171969 RepID=A0A9Q1K361_9CARY|nr:hypothetical protein Cgig2_013282 [Carnegiea gigantea]